MNRNTMIKDLTEKINSMTEDQLEQLQGLAHVITEDRSKMPSEEEQAVYMQEISELEEAARELRRAKLSPTEQAIAARIQHGRELIQEDIDHRDLMWQEMEYLKDVSYGGEFGSLHEIPGGYFKRIFSNDPARLMGDAYELGFNRGYCVRSVEVEA